MIIVWKEYLKEVFAFVLIEMLKCFYILLIFLKLRKWYIVEKWIWVKEFNKKLRTNIAYDEEGRGDRMDKVSETKKRWSVSDKKLEKKMREGDRIKQQRVKRTE